jgi:hypothetical protein
MRALLAALAAVVPWIPAVPPATPHPPLAPPCRASQLRVVAFFDQGATGSLVGGPTLANVGPPCSMLATPRVRFDATGALREGPLLAGHRPVRDGLPFRYSLRAVPTGDRVSFEFWWSNWCGPRVSRMVFTAPGGGELSAGLGRLGAPYCNSGPGSVSSLEVSPFVQHPPEPGPATELPFSVGFPRWNYRARGGSVLEYRITLRNVSKRPFTFRACPAYQEELVLGVRIVREQHMLNCTAARTFAPGQARIFDMRMRIPRGVAPQRSAIGFELGLGTYNAPQAGVSRAAVVTIR